MSGGPARRRGGAARGLGRSPCLGSVSRRWRGPLQRLVRSGCVVLYVVSCRGRVCPLWGLVEGERAARGPQALGDAGWERAARAEAEGRRSRRGGAKRTPKRRRAPLRCRSRAPAKFLYIVSSVSTAPAGSSESGCRPHGAYVSTVDKFSPIRTSTGAIRTR